MTGSRRKRIAIVFIFLLALLIAVPVVSTWRVVRQKRINVDLITAVERDDTSAAIRLLDAGADPNIKTIPSSVSFAQNLHDLLDRLRGVPRTKVTTLDMADPLLPRAVNHGNVRLAVSLLDHGAHVDAIYRIYFLNPAPPPMTSLMLAIQESSDNLERSDSLVRVLIEHGANVNWKDVNGTTPLMVAPDATIMNLLLDHGADVHARTIDAYAEGSTPLFMHDDSPALMRLLIARGANIKDRTNDGKTLVMDAAENGRAAGVRFGLDHGVDVNARDHYGNTALMYAIQGTGAPDHTPTSVEVVKILLARGANLKQSVDAAGSTPLQWARSFVDRLKNYSHPTSPSEITQVIHLLKTARARK